MRAEALKPTRISTLSKLARVLKVHPSELVDRSPRRLYQSER
jgi:hypothetical protein